MRVIKIFDAEDYNPGWSRLKRTAVRAIVFVDDLLAMVKSEKYGEYKILGGGIKEGETHKGTLAREVLEEAGLHVLPDTITPYGKTLELRRSNWADNEIFEQESFYYICEVDANLRSPPALDDDYEVEYGYKPVFVTLVEAIATNEQLLGMPEVPWVRRDLAILHEIRRML